MKDQHRLSRLQVVNWGTFDGCFDLFVPRQGLLLTGPSGSGKSSLLDAMASVLMFPQGLSFNAAAQEGGRSDRARSLVTYVRGAYKRKVDEDTGEVATDFLRPGATWSGVALTYDDLAGRVTTLIRLMHIGRGTNAATDLTSLFVLAELSVDLMDLSPFVENGIDMRRLKQAHADWFIDNVYLNFARRMQKRFGLESDQAQRLLHKTQSAKNLNSLDDLLRDFMLDEPETFRLRDQAIEQFTQLRAAHTTVVDARHQVETLLPLRQAASDRGRALAGQESVARQREHVDTVRLRFRAGAAERELLDLHTRHQGVEREIGLAFAEVAARKRDRDLALLGVEGLGGPHLDALNAEAERAERVWQAAVDERSRRDAVAARCDLRLPDDASGVDAFAAQVSRRLAALEESDQARERRHELAAAHEHSKQNAMRLANELEVAERQRSSMDPGLLGIRDQLAQEGAPAGRLPFAGELLSVRHRDAGWTGAIERVLRTFARTMLVPEDLYPLVSNYVDGRRLVDADGCGVRLVYERVLADKFAAPQGGDDVLWRKLEVADGEFAPWLRQALARFDYRCVDSAAELRRVARGVTRAGQVRHSSSRHEKDDRRDVGDRRYWVLGSSATARHEALLTELHEAERSRDLALAARDAADNASHERVGLAQQVAELRELCWDDIDTEGRQRELVAARSRVDAHLDANAGLAEARARLGEADHLLDVAEQGLREWTSKLSVLADRRERLAADLDGYRAGLTSRPDVPNDVAEALARRFEALGADTDRSAAQVRNELDAELARHIDQLRRSETLATRAMTLYKQGWPAESADVSAEVEFVAEYLTILERLQGDRLPDFEERFFQLLQGQARNNIGLIGQQLRNARRDIKERVRPINESLRQTEYQPGCHLFIKDEDRRLPEVAAFLADLAEVTSGSLDDSFGAATTETRSEAERRFAKLEGLLTRLGSDVSADQRWAKLCLDSRLHVQFTAEVRDADGSPVDWYKGAGGLSGGERQKLVAFCLAAALRFQLARSGAQAPSYGLVVLDEAFDKTDPAFTRMGLEVFRTFGFQLLLATPEKMLQTLEDYVGGAVMVTNDSGRGSRFDALIWQAEAEPAMAESPDGTGQEALL